MEKMKNGFAFTRAKGKVITVKELLLRDNYRNCKVITVDPVKESESLIVKHCGSKVNPLEIGGYKNDE
jgi:hypothetical protein